ncbi:hypothetical protein KSP39_PZI024385 [Platanthera zijinensis]|uniref:Uncharacterized protein n=1 Tax=Platanthera zijinensis TaxID=2320716 RepID=A0AAP0AU92_9ASPA
MMERERGKRLASDDDEDEGPAGEQETLLSIKLRRGLAAGKKGGPCTPPPAWKLEEEVGEELEAAAGIVERLQESVRRRQSASARKLGANLWEVQDLLLPLEGMSRRGGRPHRCRNGGGGADLRHLDETDQVESAGGGLRRHVISSLIEHRKSNKQKNNAQPLSPANFSSSMEVTPFNPTISSTSSLNLKGGIGDVGYGLKTSTELLKVLNRIWSLEEQHASKASAVNSLKVELEHARKHIQELLQEQKEHRREMDKLISQVAEDKLLRKKKEKARMKIAVQSIREEIDDEKRLRRRSESLHRKLGKELTDTKMALSMALKDLENERTSNGLLQNLCDEFARGIGQYEKEEREVKKYTKDCERKVDGLLLHISEVWLDERSQMLMAESCGEKAEKVSIVSRLKEEIISFIRARRDNNINDDTEEQHHQHNPRRQSLESLHLNGTISAPHDIEDDDSIVSEFHCFELNMAKTKGAHDHLKSLSEINSSSLESARKFSFVRKVAGTGRAKEGMDMQREVMETDADSGEAAVHQKWRNSTSVGSRERKVVDLDGSNLLTQYTTMNNLESTSGCKAHLLNYHGEISQDKFSGTGNFIAASSPVQQWNHQEMSVDPEISECSSKQPQGLKENTLKAKLLEARLEGRHARLMALKGA